MNEGSNDREAIRQFLDEQFSMLEEAGAVSIVGLVHYAHTGEVDLHSMKIGHSKWNKPDEMAQTFDSIASRHARGVSGGGAQQFQLSVCRGSDGRPTSVLPFVRVGPRSVTGAEGSLATEPPTPMGQVQQGMRMGETVVQEMLRQINPTFRVQAELIDRLMRRLAECETENREVWAACKGLLLELDKRRHDEKMSELSAARMAEFQRQVMALAPALLNMMAGKEIVPLSAADTALIDGIASWASPEDVRTITTVLAGKPGGDKLAAVLTDRYQAYYKRREAEAAAERRLISGLPARTYEEAERDAAGEAIRALHGKAGSTGERPLLPNGSNGHAKTGAPESPVLDGEKLWDELFETVDEGKIDMLTSVLAADQPDLARRLRERFEASKKR